MNVTLIYPGVGIYGFGQVLDKYVPNGELHWIQHGIGLIATCASQAGHNVSLVDMRVMHDWYEFYQTIRVLRPDVVGISISYMDKDAAFAAINIIKGNIDPNIKIVVGGLLPTIFPEVCEANEKIDYIIKGEGEVAFVELVDRLSLNNSELDAEFLEERIKQGTSPAVNDLPFVNRRFFDYWREMNCAYTPNQPTPMVTMIAGRGCPMKCTYCQPAESQVFGTKFRMRSVENVIEELKELRDKFSFASITWWDDTFTINPKWVMEFCDAYQREGFTAEMSACARADTIVKHPEMIKRLGEAGMKWFIVGLESGSDRVLSFLKKGTTVEMNRQSIEICHQHGIRMVGTFMLGLPTETKDEQAKTIDMIKTMKVDCPRGFYFTPIPGTEIYSFCEENKLMLRDDPFKIERTDEYTPKIKGVDYDYLGLIRHGVF